MSKGLKIAEPPQRRRQGGVGGQTSAASKPVEVAKFDQVGEQEKVQFNKRVTRQTADGYEMMAIRTRRKVPELLAEALILLEEKHGKI